LTFCIGKKHYFDEKSKKFVKNYVFRFSGFFPVIPGFPFFHDFLTFSVSGIGKNRNVCEKTRIFRIFCSPNLNPKMTK